MRVRILATTTHLLSVLLVWLAGCPALTQESCDVALSRAQKIYDQGLFEDVPAEVEPCLKRSTSRANLLEATLLLAKAYLALDDLDRTREAVSALLGIDPNFVPGSPPQLVRIVQEVRKKALSLQVGSVSKSAESLREAPATVIVVTAEQIEQRGYLDLESVLHDLPGFDISRGNGENYSNIFQRGFRSNGTDRVLFLINGIEQNDIPSNTIYLSRQYPLSNIDRVEVIYGPASTMYGANAFSGVVNVVSKRSENIFQENERFTLQAHAATGSFDTRFAELVAGGRSRDQGMTWMLASRFHHSAEMDLSRFASWNYHDINYKEILRLTGSEAEEFCDSSDTCIDDPQDLFTPVFDDSGQLTSVELTDNGEQLARKLDGLFFSDTARDWFVNGEIGLYNLTVGLQMWRVEEGSNSWYSKESALRGEVYGGLWTPELISFYLKYSGAIGSSLSLNLSARYRETNLDVDSSYRSQNYGYASGYLDLGDLLEGAGSYTIKESFIGSADQMAGEMTLTYRHSDLFNLVAGVEAKRTSINEPATDHSDLGLYAQAVYRPTKTLSLIAGGRIDHNEVNDIEHRNTSSDFGFGTIVSPKAGVIYAPGRWTLKGIYSEAFKDITNYERFSQELDLRPERVRNKELSIGWQPSDGTNVEIVAYESEYEDPVTLDDFQLRSFGNFLVRGVQGQITASMGQATISGNYTYTEPFSKSPAKSTSPAADSQATRLRIGDIASHRANLIANYVFPRKWNLNVRMNYVGTRRTGEGTTVENNPLRQIDAHFTAHAALNLVDAIPGTTLQLIVNNIFDEEYYDPGLFDMGPRESGDGYGRRNDRFAAQIPQPGRSIFFRVLYRAGAKKR